MKIFVKAVVLVIVANVLQSYGLGLSSALANATRAVPATEPQAHEVSTRLSQYSDNPTIPGDGTPQRTQGSGTR